MVLWGRMRAAAVLTALTMWACGSTSTTPREKLSLAPDLSSNDGGSDAGELIAEPVDAGLDPDGGASDGLCSVTDLILCFGFDGVVKDGSPNALVPSLVQGVTFMPGKVGQAAVLDRTSAIRFAPSSSFNATQATIEAWVRPAQLTLLDEGVIFDADARYAMTLVAGGSLQCNTTTTVVRGGLLSPGVWTHAACVFDGQTMHLYVDGVEKASGPGTTGKSEVAGAAIGGNAPDGSPFSGALDSLRLFHVARTAAQIAAAAAVAAP